MLLYIHIPFCSSKCGYCAFNSMVGFSHLYKDYVSALCADLKAQLQNLDSGKHLSSVFIGGGTPNILPAHFFESIFSEFTPFLRSNSEISIECNVNLLDLHWCAALRDLGVNRVSVGVQSFDEQKLKFLQREHGVRDIFGAFENLAKAGFENINADLIFGTPFDDSKLLDSEFQNLKMLGLSHISAYSLSIDEGSKFEQKMSGEQKAKISKNTQDFDAAQFVRENLQNLGFEQYEVSNYARGAAARCAHNLGYWQGREYLGCGLGAVGRIGLRRASANADLAAYLRDPHFREIENLDSQNLRVEKIMLGLRCVDGVRVGDILDSEVLDSQKYQKVQQNLEILLESKKVFLDDDFIKASDLFLADELALWLL